MYVALDPIGSSSKPKKTNNKTSQTIKTTQTTPPTPQVDSLATIAEEKRKKEIQEYKKLKDDVEKVTSEISSSSDELKSTEKMLDKCITGEFANSVKSMMQNLQGQIENATNALNVIGTKAAQKVENKGEPCTYNKQQPNSMPYNNRKGETTFSCNTDELRKVLPQLQEFNNKIGKATTFISNLPKLEGCEDIANVSKALDPIIKIASNAYNLIEGMIERAEQAEKETERIIEQLGREKSGDVTGKTNITGTITATAKKLFEGINKGLGEGINNTIESINKVAEKIKTEGVSIWKDGIEYTFKSNKVNVNGRNYTYHMLEPKNPDPNIPTLFCLDGDGQSLLAGVSGEYMEGIANGEKSFWEQTHLPLAAINQSGLDKPNIRTVYLPNPSDSIKACAMSTGVFYEIVEAIVEQNDNKIDINNMSILGHSARRKSCCTVCEWYGNRRNRTKTRSGT